MEESQEFVKKVGEKGQRSVRLPIFEALRQNPKAFLLIIALRLAELFTMYIVTAFALSYSTTNLHMPRQFFLNIGLLVGAVRCLTIPCLRHARRPFRPPPDLHDGAMSACSAPCRSSSRSMPARRVWIVFFAVMLANIAHDMVVSVQQPMFTELFGTEYPIQRRRRGLSGGERGRRRLHAVHRRGAGELRRRFVASGCGVPGDWLPDFRAGRRRHEADVSIKR